MTESRRVRLEPVWNVTRWLLLAVAVAGVWACHAPTLERPTLQPTASAEHAFAENHNPKLDILFMVDDSSSMHTAQANLRDNLPSFINALKKISGGMPDVHIAVVTSDLGADTDNEHCSHDGDGGRFKFGPGVGCSATNLAAGAHFISSTGGENPQTNFTGDITQVFQCIATVGEDGCGFEHQLASVARALGADGAAAPSENTGFLRPDAYLGIVLVTNEDDCSAPASSPIFQYSVALASTYGPSQNFVCNEWGHLCSQGGGPPARPSRNSPNHSTSDVVVYSPAGGPDNCVSAEGQGLLTSVGRSGYADWIKALKPDPASQIMVAAIAGPPTPYAVDWFDAKAGDTGPWPEIKHSCGSEADPAGFADPAVRIAQFVAEFGGNGLFYPFCSTNYGPALQTIGDKLATFIAPKCIAGTIATRAGSPTPECTVTELVGGPTTAAKTVIPACADNGHMSPCWTLGAAVPGDKSGCEAGTHVVSIDRGGVTPPDRLVDQVDCALCLDGVPPDPSQSCIP